MTEPGSVGDAYINVHGRTDEVEGDIRRGLEKAGPPAEKEGDKLGKDVGDHLGKSLEKEVSKHGPSIAKEIGNAVEKEVIDVKPNLRYNVRGRNGQFIKRTAQTITDEVEAAFSQAASKGGFFDNIRQGIADAVGAGFNVSGKSPLVGILIPVIGAIAAAVVGAIQIVNSLLAVLAAAPAAVAAIGVQAFILISAFNGVGAAITGAFAAKNAKELKEAIKALTPAAQEFVKGLLPAKQLMADIQKSAQQGFFTGLGNVINRLITEVGPIFKQGAGPLATALGLAANKIASVFLSPAFKGFINDVIPATINWLSNFGPAFNQFLLGLISLADATLPFLTRLGDLLNGALVDFGGKLFDLGHDDSFKGWLDDMFTTLKKVGPLVGALLMDLAIIFEQVNKGSGDKAITGITDALVTLGTFLASPAGLRAIETLTDLGLIAIEALTGVLIIIGELLAALSLLTDWFIMGVKGFVAFAVWLGLLLEDVVKTVGRFIADVFMSVVSSIVNFFFDLGHKFEELWRFINTSKGRLLLEVTQIPGQIKNALGNLANLLFNAGKDLINGLINGIRNSIGSLKATLSSITNLLPSWKGPEDKDKKILEPAGRAVMEGFGAGIKAGATDIKSMLGDFTAGMGDLALNQSSTHILFGANALQVNFRGALPTQDQAMNAGTAIGAGINSQLAARNTRLAVRTL